MPEDLRAKVADYLVDNSWSGLNKPITYSINDDGVLIGVILDTDLI